MKIIKRFVAWYKCEHPWVRGVYGDEINHANGRRLSCVDCGRYLEGNLSDANVDYPYGRDERL